MATHAPSEMDARYSIAKGLWESGDTERCEVILRDLAARDPAREDVIGLLATLLQNEGRLDAASQVMFDLCSAHSFAPPLSLRGVQFIQNCHRQPLAARLCDSVLAAHRPTPDLLAVAGNIAREEGHFDKARAFYEEAIGAGVDLNSRFVLGALAHTIHYSDDLHPDFARFIAHFRNEAFSPRARAATGFGLAKAWDDIGDHASAARTLRISNALVRSVLPWSTSAWDEAVQARLRESIARLPAAMHPGFIPVFIVGLLRTGTTVAAKHIAQHTGARDRGEMRTLRFIADRLVEGGHLRDVAAIEEAAGLYRKHARQDDGPAIAYIDQDPLNFRNLRFIEALFPNARIIHCQRDPRDAALSMWSQDFASRESAFAYDFKDIAAYAAGHDRLMQQWKSQLALPIHTLDYETFVADPQSSFATLSAFLDFPDGSIEREATSAPIGSASVWQARQPIYRSSVGRWRNYAPYVPELTSMWSDPT